MVRHEQHVEVEGVHTLTHSHSHTLILAHTRTHSHTHSHTHTLTHTLSHSKAGRKGLAPVAVMVRHERHGDVEGVHTLTHSHTLSHTLTHSLTHEGWKGGARACGSNGRS